MRTRTASSANRNHIRHTIRHLCFQPLEARRVLDSGSQFSGGVLTIHADDESNEIGVSANLETNTLTVRIDATVLEFPNNAVRHINIYGNGGGDTIVIRPSVPQTTLLDGGRGNDSISGSEQHDAILGGPGNDRLAGNGGADRMDGGLGDDKIAGGDGPDGIQGGVGSDVIRGGGGGDEILGDPAPELEDLPDDEDELSLEKALDRSANSDATLSVKALALEAEPVPALPTFNDLIYGDDGDDVIRAGRGHDQVHAGRGNDAVSGGSGVDYIEGGDGNDRLGGDGGVDVIFGGAGDDHIGGGRGGDYLIGGNGHDEIHGGVGNDWIFGDATNSYPSGYTDPVVYARDFADTNRGSDTIMAGDGDDNVFAGNGRDKVDGGAGRDAILGGAGNDYLLGGIGSDYLNGGEGEDTIEALDGEIDVILTDGFDDIFADEIDWIIIP